MGRMLNMKSIILGAGEVGKSLQEVLDCDIYDPYVEEYNVLKIKEYYMIHVCYPYMKDFEKITNGYLSLLTPNILVIHSTVPIGTTRKFGKSAVHSPITGKHPKLVESIKTFIKYIGPVDKNIGREVYDYFLSKGITSYICNNPETSEALKLFSTFRYCLTVVGMKKVLEYCKENNIDPYIVYHHATETYNEGYKTLGFPQYVRPLLSLEEGPIGGHCVIKNLDLTPDFFNDIIEVILENNERWKQN
jgi:hypothetical protein